MWSLAHSTYYLTIAKHSWENFPLVMKTMKVKPSKSLHVHTNYTPVYTYEQYAMVLSLIFSISLRISMYVHVAIAHSFLSL